MSRETRCLRAARVPAARRRRLRRLLQACARPRAGPAVRRRGAPGGAPFVRRCLPGVVGGRGGEEGGGGGNGAVLGRRKKVGELLERQGASRSVGIAYGLRSQSALALCRAGVDTRRHDARELLPDRCRGRWAGGATGPP